MVISSIIVLGVLILVHELGHFFAARISGIRVTELALGFGPKIFGWERNKTKFSLRIFPLGGFCRMLGETPEEAEEPDSLPQKPAIKRAFVLASGSLMNLFLALLLFFMIFFLFLGIPDTESTSLGYILENSPADKAGLVEGDKLLAIDGEAVSNWDDIITGISAKPDQKVELLVVRNAAGLSHTYSTQEMRDMILENDPNPSGYNINDLLTLVDREKTFIVVPEIFPETDRVMIGIGQSRERFQFIPSLKAGASEFGGIISSITQVITGRAPLDVAGPVGIFIVIGEVAQTGLINLIFLTAVISVSLGIMNLLPIPALDGGRLLFLLVETVRGKKIDPEKEGLIHFIGFALLILLVLFVTYYDLIRWDILQSN